MSKLRILFVCTANICRSPTAEAFLRKCVAEADLSGAIEVSSCGISESHLGAHPPQSAVDCAQDRGCDISAHRARQIRAADLDQFDLVLAMDRGQLNWLRRLRRGTARIDRFLDYATGGKVRKDVPDPYGGDARKFEKAAQRIEDAMPLLLETLRSDFPIRR